MGEYPGNSSQLIISNHKDTKTLRNKEYLILCDFVSWWFINSQKLEIIWSVIIIKQNI